MSLKNKKNFQEVIPEIWSGEINNIDWCESCKYSLVSDTRKRYCSYLNFHSFGMKVSDCIYFKGKDVVPIS